MAPGGSPAGGRIMKVEGEYRAGCLRIVYSGELDHHGAADALRCSERLVDRYLPRDCALDFRNVAFMDSSGIALILRVYRQMQETGGRVCVLGVGSQPGRVLAASGVERMVPIQYAEMRAAN